MIEFKKQESQYEKTEAPRITGSEGETREYVAEVVKIESFQSKSHPDWAPAIKFIFRVLEEPFVGGFASGLAPSAWAEGNKLDRWLTAMGVSGAKIGDQFSSDTLKKAVVRATIKIKDGFPTVTDLGLMSERDFKRISPDAHKKPSQKPAANQPAAVTTAKPAASTPVSAQPVQQGEVTQDESLPF